MASGLESQNFVALGPAGLEGRRESKQLNRVCLCAIPGQWTCLRRHLEQGGLLQISRWRQAWGSACSICRVDTRSLASVPARGGEAFGQQEQGSARTPFVVLSPCSYSNSGLPVLNPCSYSTSGLPGHPCSCGWSECGFLRIDFSPISPGNTASAGAQCSAAPRLCLEVLSLGCSI